MKHHSIDEITDQELRLVRLRKREFSTTSKVHDYMKYDRIIYNKYNEVKEKNYKKSRPYIGYKKL